MNGPFFNGGPDLVYNGLINKIIHRHKIFIFIGTGPSAAAGLSFCAAWT